MTAADQPPPRAERPLPRAARDREERVSPLPPSGDSAEEGRRDCRRERRVVAGTQQQRDFNHALERGTAHAGNAVNRMSAAIAKAEAIRDTLPS